ncbi:BRO family protein [Thermaerobacillus caldiproteolyticus]|uniref:BRO family protein n=1 Tax=Thermaerobacillus caldiproteolyticus TaxID=247480 RepID=UPI0018F221FD|nr:phage antirepressor [Anoxybacillus caldiproteolyticus]
MNQLAKVFTYGGTQVRTVVKDGEVWFVAKDVCDVLEINNSRQAVARLDDDEKADVIINDGSQSRHVSAVNESGLYSLILTSRKPEAKQFKRWVTHEVLPTIRKTGGYVSNDDMFIQTYLPFADEQTKMMFRGVLETVRKQNEQIAMMKPKAEAHDKFISGENYQSMNVVAKTLGTGRNRLYDFLRKQKILMSNNVPYQEYIERGYFVVREKSIQMGEQVINKPQTYVTAKGVDFIFRLLQEKSA